MEVLSVFCVVVIRCTVESDGRDIMPTKKVEFVDVKIGADFKIHEFSLKCSRAFSKSERVSSE